ncbi:hypothetical protein INR77_09625 [Erythrobacter sp. SCSIO 43205]|uniref:hypothetical protein n=1 Tax=Erythrobacter sp. SCSIO 43205 TaxID=2779361 RepID=UPI001CA864D2|nr:hypothetical protein [Erythrobacter sp. SCSIO 43205]UAB77092.1 hypothetical protein INR77_09625 [Erythrobacter sp. SCSIO 43205]
MTIENAPIADQEKRDALRQKIEANERRIAERTLGEQAKEVVDAAVDYTKANPLTVIAGAVAVGITIGLMTKPGRRIATTAATSAAGVATQAASKVSDAAGSAANAAKGTVASAAIDRSTAVWALIADKIVDHAMDLIDEVLGGATAGKDALEDIGDSAAAKARTVRREAEYIAGTAADKSRTATQRGKRRATRAVRDLTNRVRH